MGQDDQSVGRRGLSRDLTVTDWQTAELVATLEGHTDFVKSVTVLPTTPSFLLSTSSDRTCRLWDLMPLQSRQAPVCRQVVKLHTRPVETAAYFVGEDLTVTVWTSDSMGVIKEWTINKVPPPLCGADCNRKFSLMKSSRSLMSRT